MKVWIVLLSCIVLQLHNCNAAATQRTDDATLSDLVTQETTTDISTPQEDLTTEVQDTPTEMVSEEPENAVTEAVSEKTPHELAIEEELLRRAEESERRKLELMAREEELKRRAEEEVRRKEELQRRADDEKAREAAASLLEGSEPVVENIEEKTPHQIALEEELQRRADEQLRREEEMKLREEEELRRQEELQRRAEYEATLAEANIPIHSEQGDVSVDEELTEPEATIEESNVKPINQNGRGGVIVREELQRIAVQEANFNDFEESSVPIQNGHGRTPQRLAEQRKKAKDQLFETHSQLRLDEPTPVDNDALHEQNLNIKEQIELKNMEDGLNHEAEGVLLHQNEAHEHELINQQKEEMIRQQEEERQRLEEERLREEERRMQREQERSNEGVPFKVSGRTYVQPYNNSAKSSSSVVALIGTFLIALLM